MHTEPLSSASYVCNELPWDLAYSNALNFAHHSGPSFLESVSQVAYASGVPVSYIVCEKDLVVRPEVQRGFVKVLEEAGRGVSVVSLESGE